MLHLLEYYQFYSNSSYTSLSAYFISEANNRIVAEQTLKCIRRCRSLH